MMHKGMLGHLSLKSGKKTKLFILYFKDRVVFNLFFLCVTVYISKQFWYSLYLTVTLKIELEENHSVV